METEATRDQGAAACSEQGTKRVAFSVISLFPSYFEGPLATSILGRAKEAGLLSVQLIDLRDYGEGGYRRVDDRPFGGGPGMVLMAGPVKRAIENVRQEGSRVVFLSPQGRRLEARSAKRLASYDHIVLVCGHYEGLDQRVIDQEVDEEVSIGDFVLTNGCLPALVVMDAVARFGVLAEEAVELESFQQGLLEGPHYTRPVAFEGEVVPEVLRGGDHQRVEAWRHQQGMSKTRRERPDLLADYMGEARTKTLSSAGLTLWVEQLVSSIAFYKRVLGWEVELLGERKAVLQAPGIGVILVEGRGSEESGAYLWTSTFSGILQRIRRSGWSHRITSDDRGEKRLEIADPDGHLWSIGLSQE